MAGPDRRGSLQIEACDGFHRGRFEAMASECEVLCETESPDEARRLTRVAADETWRIEQKFSRYLADNAIDRINSAAGKPVAVDAETARLLDFAAAMQEVSEGRFDITSGALRRVWTFDGSDRVPSQSAVDAVMRSVGWHRVSWADRRLQMPPGMEIDLGGIGKEYAVDRAAALLRQETDSSCLVNLGGDLAVTRAPVGFVSWRVGIEADSMDVTLPDSLLNLRVGALATSGDARRYLEKGGRRYGHILDARTGWPVPGAPGSVTVAADTCTQAGMLSTLAMLEGEGAEAFLAAQNVQYWCVR